jgi:hypothetical protein
VYIEGIGRVDFLVRGMATLRFDYREIVYGADEVVRTIKAVLALGPRARNGLSYPGPADRGSGPPRTSAAPRAPRPESGPDKVRIVPAGRPVRGRPEG